MSMQQREEVAALGMVSTFRVDWELTLRKEHSRMKETWQGGLHGKVRGQKKVSLWNGAAKWQWEERNFLRDQSERTLLSKVAIDKTSALMEVTENPPKEEKLECLVSAEAPTSDHNYIWQVRSICPYSHPSRVPTWKSPKPQWARWEWV